VHRDPDAAGDRNLRYTGARGWEQQVYKAAGNDSCQVCNMPADEHIGAMQFCRKGFANAVAKVQKIQTVQLFSLCREGNAGDVDRLIAARCPVDAQDRLGRTPLHCACRWGNDSIVKSLLAAGANATAKANSGASALRFACEGGGVGCVRVLVKAGVSCNDTCDESGRTILHLACRKRAAGICELLLEHKADVGAKDLNNSTPLHESGLGSEEAKLLLAYNADVEARDIDHRTPLHKMAFAGNSSTCALLLGARAQVNAKDGEGGQHATG
jgi:ankyrin repeat protein